MKRVWSSMPVEPTAADMRVEASDVHAAHPQASLLMAREEGILTGERKKTMAVKKPRDRLAETASRFIEGKASREELAEAAAHYDRVTRVKLQPALRQLIDVMKQKIA
jgi:hypothetical protein